MLAQMLAKMGRSFLCHATAPILLAFLGLFGFFVPLITSQEIMS